MADAHPKAPDYRIEVDGQVITPTVRRVLSSLRLTDHSGGDADELKLDLVDDGSLAIPPTGVTIRVAIGWQGDGLTDRGHFTADEIEHSGAPDTLSILARSANMRARLPGKKTKSWDDIAIGAIINTIAGTHDIDHRVEDDLADTVIPHIDQTDESDLNFLTRLGERFDAVAAVKDDKLLFLPAGQGQTVSGQSLPSAHLTRADGDRHRYSITDRDSTSGVTADWHRVDDGDKHTVVAGKQDHAKHLRAVFATEDDALAAAQSEWQRIQRGERRLSYTLAEGRADLVAEMPVQISGLPSPIDGIGWQIKTATHNLTASGYTTDLKLEMIGQSRDSGP
ncbi:phage late control D family protein [Salinisphaera sp. USBA-960]|nr:phage late control D family protein [Salifodinibacter halophilus]NNC25290.1 phage late control D family protein [Salifodinibacter halophilus]